VRRSRVGRRTSAAKNGALMLQCRFNSRTPSAWLFRRAAHRFAFAAAVSGGLLSAGSVQAETIGGALVTTIVQGDVGSVRAAVEAGKEAASRVGNLVASHIIARPADDLLKFFTT